MSSLKHFLIWLGFFSCLLVGTVSSQGISNPLGMNAETEEESEYGYCNMFYVKSNDTFALPFDDICFVNDIHKVGADYLYMRYVGPVNNIKELFVAREWGIYIMLPQIEQEARFPIAIPSDLSEMEGAPPEGKAFLFLAQNKGPTEYEYQSYYDNVDFRAVSGTVRVYPLEPDPNHEEWYEEMEYEAVLDVFVQKVDNSSGTPVLKGDKIRLKSTFYIKKNQD